MSDHENDPWYRNEYDPKPKEARMYDANGDMIAQPGQLFRQIGWQINGGESDGQFIAKSHETDLHEVLKGSHGGFSPVYVEVGKD